MVGHESCSVGHMSKAEERRKQGNPPRQPFTPPKAKVGRPRKFNPISLKLQPKDCPLREHPYILWLALQWEEADAKIQSLTKQQDKYKKAAEAFEKHYPQNVEPTPL